jgi:O-antigen/teichoic acid export membrane protein
VVEILTAAGIWVLLSIDRGLLQARQDYRNLSINLILEAVTKTAGTIGFAAIWGVTGAALGILVAEVITAVHARVTAMAALARRPEGTEPDPGPADGTVPAASTHTARHLAADMVTALVSLALLAVLQNADVIGFDSQAPHHSGSYAAISVPSKALVFGALVFVNYLLPESAIRWHQGSHALRQLGHTLLILALPAIVLVGASVAAPKTLLDVVFGAKLAKAAPAFSTLALAMVFLSVTVVLTVYLLGVGYRWVVLLLAVGTGALILFTLRAKGHYVATARADLVVQAVLTLATAAALVAVHVRAGRRWSTGGREDPVGPATVPPDQGTANQGPVSESGYRGPG